MTYVKTLRIIALYSDYSVMKLRSIDVLVISLVWFANAGTSDSKLPGTLQDKHQVMYWLYKILNYLKTCVICSLKELLSYQFMVVEDANFPWVLFDTVHVGYIYCSCMLF